MEKHFNKFQFVITTQILNKCPSIQMTMEAVHLETNIKDSMIINQEALMKHGVYYLHPLMDCLVRELKVKIGYTDMYE